VFYIWRCIAERLPHTRKQQKEGPAEVSTPAGLSHSWLYRSPENQFWTIAFPSTTDARPTERSVMCIGNCRNHHPFTRRLDQFREVGLVLSTTFTETGAVCARQSHHRSRQIPHHWPLFARP
jgi:hypothetical protein